MKLFGIICSSPTRTFRSLDTEEVCVVCDPWLKKIITDAYINKWIKKGINWKTDTRVNVWMGRYTDKWIHEWANTLNHNIDISDTQINKCMKITLPFTNARHMEVIHKEWEKEKKKTGRGGGSARRAYMSGDWQVYSRRPSAEWPLVGLTRHQAPPRPSRLARLLQVRPRHLSATITPVLSIFTFKACKNWYYWW